MYLNLQSPLSEAIGPGEQSTPKEETFSLISPIPVSNAAGGSQQILN